MIAKFNATTRNDALDEAFPELAEMASRHAARLAKAREEVAAELIAAGCVPSEWAIVTQDVDPLLNDGRSWIVTAMAVPVSEGKADEMKNFEFNMNGAVGGGPAFVEWVTTGRVTFRAPGADRHGHEVRINDVVRLGNSRVRVTYLREQAGVPLIAVSDGGVVNPRLWEIVEKDGKPFASGWAQPQATERPTANALQAPTDLRKVLRDAINERPFITLAAFDAIVRKVVAEEAPRATVVTDKRPRQLLAWVNLLGIERDHPIAFSDDSTNSGSLIDQTRGCVRELVRRLGERTAGK